MIDKELSSDYYYQTLYGKTSYTTEFFLVEDRPHVFHSSFHIENFHFTDRIDLFSVVDPSGKILMIDVGKNELCGREALDGIVRLVDSSWDNVDVFITHLHDDHDGNVPYVIERGAHPVWVGYVPPSNPDQNKKYMIRTGVVRHEGARKELQFAIDRHMNKRKDRYEYGPVVKEVKQGSVFTIGGYSLEVLATPGHAYEHISLLEREKGFMFTGDHILDAAPGVMQFDEDCHIVLKFLESLNEIRSMQLETLYLSHHEPIRGKDQVYSFITKQIDSYEKPIHIITEMLSHCGQADIFTMAASYFERHKNRSFKDLDGLMRMRKISIMYGYLDYLVDRGDAKRLVANDGRFLYSI